MTIKLKLLNEKRYNLQKIITHSAILIDIGLLNGRDRKDLARRPDCHARNFYQSIVNFSGETASLN